MLRYAYLLCFFSHHQSFKDSSVKKKRKIWVTFDGKNNFESQISALFDTSPLQQLNRRDCHNAHSIFFSLSLYVCLRLGIFA